MCCAKHVRGAWLVGHNEVQGVWKQAVEEAGFTARVDVKHGLPPCCFFFRLDPPKRGSGLVGTKLISGQTCRGENAAYSIDKH